MDRPEEEPTEKPTETTKEAKAEGAWMFQNWIAVAVVSIFGMLLLVLGLMQWSGLIDLFAPVADTQGAQWIGFAGLALIVVAIAIWSWRSVAASK